MDFSIVVIFSYISGSIPFGLILTKLFINRHVRKIGSGNIGATNVLRTGNKYLAATTLILDILKGYAPVVITKHYFPELLQLSALLAFLGHVFPIWLKFNGGKGVATYIGFLFGINFIFGFIFIVSWIIIAFIKKYSSLSSITSLIIIPIYIFFYNYNLLIVLFFIYLSILIIFKHSTNIRRLFNNSEIKIKF